MGIWVYRQLAWYGISWTRGREQGSHSYDSKNKTQLNVRKDTWILWSMPSEIFVNGLIKVLYISLLETYDLIIKVLLFTENRRFSQSSYTSENGWYFWIREGSKSKRYFYWVKKPAGAAKGDPESYRRGASRREVAMMPKGAVQLL